VRAETLLRAAVAKNARWCDAVCRSHGHPGVFTERMWVSARHAVPFYPNAITLSPDVTAAETGADQDPSRPYGVKDSFARLDLAPAGMAPLFDAEWIAFLQAPQGSAEDGLRWDSVTDPGELARWETAWAGATRRPCPGSPVRPASSSPRCWTIPDVPSWSAAGPASSSPGPSRTPPPG
jgi:hypothetical protein